MGGPVHALDERGLKPWEALGVTYAVWHHRTGGGKRPFEEWEPKRRTRYPVDEHGRRPWEAEGLTYEAWRGRLNRASKVRINARQFADANGRVDVGRRGWHSAIMYRFGASHGLTTSTISKAKHDFEQKLGYEIPSYFEAGSEAEAAFLLDFENQLLPGLVGEAGPTLEDVPPSLRAKHEARMRALVREQERSFELRVHAAAVELLDRQLLARLAEREKRSEEMEAAWRGIFSKAEYQLLLKCLHPDSNCDADQYNAAFALIRERGDVLLKREDRKPRIGEDMPRTFEELMARRKR